MSDPKSSYRCLNESCGELWEGDPGPTQCPKCGGINVKWLNYESQFSPSSRKIHMTEDMSNAFDESLMKSGTALSKGELK